MRHFRSILYALVLAPAIWVLVGVGLTHDLTARGRDGFAVESFTGLLLLVLGGAAYGILVFAPISPAGPFMAGVAYLGVGIWAIQAPSGYSGVWPAGVTKPGFDLSRPGYGLAALLAVPMILTVLSARRWEKYEPPVLPIIGQIGRARGAAAAPGTPMAIAETHVIPRRPYRDSGSGLGIFSEPDRTAVLRAESANTTALVVTSPDEPTVLVLGEEPTVLVLGEESTVLVLGEEPAEEETAPVASEQAVEGEAAGADEAAEDETAEDESSADKTTAMVNGTVSTVDFGAGRAGSGDGERTQVLRLPAASDNGDEMTQAIRLPMGAEPTQAIRLPVAENGEKTQMLRLPVDTVPVDTVPVDTVPIDVASPASIADAERPNFAEDPTGRLLPPGPASEEPTRTMTVMNLERPPDEIPTQRRHTPDEN